MVDLASLLVPGHGPEHITGMDPRLQQALTALYAAAPPEIQQALRIQSGYRSVERQAQLWHEALVKYGSPEAARRWVAPPGNSQHNHGRAADLSYANDAVREWVHSNAANYGLSFPMGHEPWHIELSDARSGGHPASTGGAGRPGPTRAAAAGTDPSNPLNMAAMTPAATAEPVNPFAEALLSAAQPMVSSMPEMIGPRVTESGGPFMASALADQRRTNLRGLKDMLMPTVERTSTSPMMLVGGRRG